MFSQPKPLRTIFNRKKGQFDIVEACGEVPEAVESVASVEKVSSDLDGSKKAGTPEPSKLQVPAREVEARSLGVAQDLGEPAPASTRIPAGPVVIPDESIYRPGCLRR